MRTGSSGNALNAANDLPPLNAYVALDRIEESVAPLRAREESRAPAMVLADTALEIAKDSLITLSRAVLTVCDVNPDDSLSRVFRTE